MNKNVSLLATISDKPFDQNFWSVFNFQRHTEEIGNPMTNPAQRAESVKMPVVLIYEVGGVGDYPQLNT